MVIKSTDWLFYFEAETRRLTDQSLGCRVLNPTTNSARQQSTEASVALMPAQIPQETLTCQPTYGLCCSGNRVNARIPPLPPSPL